MKLINKFNSVKQQVKTVQQQIGFAQAFFKLVGDPNNTMLVFELEDKMTGTSNPEEIEKVVNQFKQIPELGSMFEERYLAPDYKIEDLADSKPGTLGYAYYRHMHDNGFSQDFFPEVKPVDDLSFFELRMRQTHDIWHVVTGFSPSIEDEVGLQAFYAAQMNSPFNMTLVAAGMLHGAIRNPKLYRPIMEATILGWEMGKAAKLLAPRKWEQMWDRSLEEIRRELNVKPARTLYDFSPAQEGELAVSR
jgi:ubiquinone biosynthesis protein Coq4